MITPPSRGGPLPPPAGDQPAPLDRPPSDLTESAIIEARGGAPEQFKHTVRRARRQLRKRMNPPLLEAFNKFSHALNSGVTGAELEEIGKHLADTLGSPHAAIDPASGPESALDKRAVKPLVAQGIASPELMLLDVVKENRVVAHKIAYIKVEAATQPSDPPRPVEHKIENKKVEAAFTICTSVMVEFLSEEWQSLIVYLHSADLADKVDRTICEKGILWHSRLHPWRLVSTGTVLRFVPRAKDFEFDPPSREVVWNGDIQEYEFRFRALNPAASKAMVAEGMAGVVEVYDQTKNEGPSPVVEPEKRMGFWKRLFGGGKPQPGVQPRVWGDKASAGTRRPVTISLPFSMEVINAATSKSVQASTKTKDFDFEAEQARFLRAIKTRLDRDVEFQSADVADLISADYFEWMKATSAGSKRKFATFLLLESLQGLGFLSKRVGVSWRGSEDSDKFDPDCCYYIVK